MESMDKNFKVTIISVLVKVEKRYRQKKKMKVIQQKVRINEKKSSGHYRTKEYFTSSCRLENTAEQNQ